MRQIPLAGRRFEELKEIGPCQLVTLTPDGKRMIVQAGFKTKGAHRQKWSIWLYEYWSMYTRTGAHKRDRLKLLLNNAIVQQIYQWIDEKHLLLKIKRLRGGGKGEEGKEYVGVLRLP